MKTFKEFCAEAIAYPARKSTQRKRGWGRIGLEIVISTEDGNLPNRTTVTERLLKASVDHGGAWVPYVPPFLEVGDEILLLQYESPSHVPDSWHDTLTYTSGENCIAFKGKMVPFTTAAKRREQNRGIGVE